MSSACELDHAKASSVVVAGMSVLCFAAAACFLCFVSLCFLVPLLAVPVISSPVAFQHRVAGGECEKRLSALNSDAKMRRCPPPELTNARSVPAATFYFHCE
jgi:hypothetical protein